MAGAAGFVDNVAEPPGACGCSVAQVVLSTVLSLRFLVSPVIRRSLVIRVALLLFGRSFVFIVDFVVSFWFRIVENVRVLGLVVILVGLLVGVVRISVCVDCIVETVGVVVVLVVVIVVRCVRLVV